VARSARSSTPSATAGSPGSLPPSTNCNLALPRIARASDRLLDAVGDAAGLAQGERDADVEEDVGIHNREAETRRADASARGVVWRRLFDCGAMC
jgi:hypothetical protein